MSVLLTLISGVISGGATGLLGVLLQRFFDFKNKQLEIEVVKLNHANALALAGMETERARMRAEADERIAERDAEARENEAAERSLVASYEHDKAAYLDAKAQRGRGFWPGLIRFMMAFVDFLRGVLRPGMTVYLTIIVTMMFTTILQLLNERGYQVTTIKLEELLAQIVATILYCFTTCVVWWFGSRPKRQGDR